jgi:hypothetical protein
MLAKSRDVTIAFSLPASLPLPATARDQNSQVKENTVEKYAVARSGGSAFYAASRYQATPQPCFLLSKNWSTFFEKPNAESKLEIHCFSRTETCLLA